MGPDNGSCNEFMHKYYFNSATSSCEIFIYGIIVCKNVIGFNLKQIEFGIKKGDAAEMATTSILRLTAWISVEMAEAI